MEKFGVGFLVGLWLMIILTYMFPRNISAVNVELEKAGLAHYEKGDIVWNEVTK